MSLLSDIYLYIHNSFLTLFFNPKFNNLKPPKLKVNENAQLINELNSNFMENSDLFVLIDREYFNFKDFVANLKMYVIMKIL